MAVFPFLATRARSLQKRLHIVCGIQAMVLETFVDSRAAAGEGETYVQRGTSFHGQLALPPCEAAHSGE
jgi:hypothetical protein